MKKGRKQKSENPFQMRHGTTSKSDRMMLTNAQQHIHHHRQMLNELYYYYYCCCRIYIQSTNFELVNASEVDDADTAVAAAVCPHTHTPHQELNKWHFLNIINMQIIQLFLYPECSIHLPSISFVSLVVVSVDHWISHYLSTFYLLLLLAVNRCFSSRNEWVQSTVKWHLLHHYEWRRVYWLSSHIMDKLFNNFQSEIKWWMRMVENERDQWDRTWMPRPFFVLTFFIDICT